MVLAVKLLREVNPYRPGPVSPHAEKGGEEQRRMYMDGFKSYLQT